MDGETGSGRAADRDAARAAERRRARIVARILARAIAALALALLTAGAIAAFMRARDGGPSAFFFALAALQAAVLISCAWSALYGTQLYWALGLLEALLFRRIEARSTRRRDG